MKKYIPQLFILLVVCYLVFLIRPAIFGQLGGTLKSHTVPQEYRTLEKFLESKSSFSRSLWIPSFERYGYYSPTHPAVNAEDMYHVASIAGVLDNLKKQSTKTFLEQRSIKYIIVPYDPEGELFLKDRKYDKNLYKSTITALQKIPWLHEIYGFGKIHVFELATAKDHFWISNDTGALVSYTYINPTKYMLTVKNGKKREMVVFADAYDKNWQLTVETHKIDSSHFENSLNSFVLPESGSYAATVYYTPQRVVNIGLVISLLTAISIGVYFFIKLIQVHFRKSA